MYLYVVLSCLENISLTIHCGQSLKNTDLDSLSLVKATDHQAKENLLVMLIPPSVYFSSRQRFSFDGTH